MLTSALLWKLNANCFLSEPLVNQLWPEASQDRNEGHLVRLCPMPRKSYPITPTVRVRRSRLARVNSGSSLAIRPRYFIPGDVETYSYDICQTAPE